MSGIHESQFTDVSIFRKKSYLKLLLTQLNRLIFSQVTYPVRISGERRTGTKWVHWAVYFTKIRFTLFRCFPDKFILWWSWNSSDTQFWFSKPSFDCFSGIGQFYSCYCLHCMYVKNTDRDRRIGSETNGTPGCNFRLTPNKTDPSKLTSKTDMKINPGVPM